MNPNFNAYSLLFTIVFTSFVAFTYGTGRYAFGLFVPQIELTFGISTLHLGLIASVATTAFVLITLISSMVAQQARAIWMICTSGLVTSFGCLLVYLAVTPGVLILGIVLASACVGVAPPSEYRIIDEHLAPKWQNRAIACLNCGGSIGILAVGAISYSLGGNWQLTWLVFCGCALLVTICAVLILPPDRCAAMRSEPQQRFPLKTIYRPGTKSLLALCSSYGLLLGSFYTYAAKLLAKHGGYSEDFQEWFWVMVGTSGLVTIFSGDLISRIGIKPTLIASHGLNAGSCVLITLFIANEYAVTFAAIAFGIGSMVPGSALLIWSMRLYKNFPSIAFGVMFAFMSIGQALGSGVAGYLADTLGLSVAFLTSGAIVLISLLFAPADTANQ